MPRSSNPAGDSSRNQRLGSSTEALIELIVSIGNGNNLDPHRPSPMLKAIETDTITLFPGFSPGISFHNLSMPYRRCRCESAQFVCSPGCNRTGAISVDFYGWDERRPDARKISMTPEAPNLYKLLGVSPSATGDEITRAYRSAMKRVHPDAQQPERRVAAEERAKQLN